MSITLCTPRRRVSRLATAAFATCAAGAMFVPATAFAQSDSGDGEKTRPTPEQIAERRQCYADHGVNLPEPQLDENGKPVRPKERPQLTDEQRAAFRAAAEACGGPPGGPRGHHRHRPQLTDEQKACLEEQGIQKPEKPADGERPPRPTEEQRAKFRAAAEACGIDLPERPAGAPDDAPKEESTSTSAAA